MKKGNSQPYLRNKPGALLMDDFTADWTPEVIKLAKSMQLELILVAKGNTKFYQELDVAVISSMKRKRERIALEERCKGKTVLDNIEETVNRAYKAYHSIDVNTILRGWTESNPLLIPLLKKYLKK